MHVQTKSVSNRPQLIRAIRDAGYAGPFTDPAVIKTWCQENGLVIDDETFDDVWTKTVTIAVTADGGENVEVTDGTKQVADDEQTPPSEGETPEQKSAAHRLAALEKKFAKFSTPSGYNRVANESSAPMTKAISHARISARKAYDLRASQGRTMLPDSESAEAFAAQVRLGLSHIGGGFEYSEKSYDRDIVTKALGGAVNTLGGALVPEIFNASLIYLTENYGVAQKLANVQTMTSDTARFPRKTGIGSMAFLAENNTYSNQDNSYDNVMLVAKDAGRLCRVSTRILEDSAVSIADDLANTFAEAKNVLLDSCYFNGIGGTAFANIQGLISALPSSAYINGAGATWASLTLANFHTLMGSVENVNASRLAFACSRQFFFQVMTRLATTTARGSGGDGSITAALRPRSFGDSSGPDADFMGYPVYFSQSLPTASAGTTKSCYFGDFMGATMIGDRRTLKIMQSDHRFFDSDQIAFLATTRFDVNIHGDGRGSTYGPVTCLVTT